MKNNRQDAAKFMKKIMPCFRPPTTDEGSAKGLMDAYVGALSEFDGAVLDQAANNILRTRLDPFFPTLAQCIAACEKIGADASKAAADKKCAETYARLRIDNGTAHAGDYWTLGLPLPDHIVVRPECPGDPCAR